jgi:hypothetical protein
MGSFEDPERKEGSMSSELRDAWIEAEMTLRAALETVRFCRREGIYCRSVERRVRLLLNDVINRRAEVAACLDNDGLVFLREVA